MNNIRPFLIHIISSRACHELLSPIQVDFYLRNEHIFHSLLEILPLQRWRGPLFFLWWRSFCWFLPIFVRFLLIVKFDNIFCFQLQVIKDDPVHLLRVQLVPSLQLHQLVYLHVILQQLQLQTVDMRLHFSVDFSLLFSHPWVYRFFIFDGTGNVRDHNGREAQGGWRLRHFDCLQRPSTEWCCSTLTFCLILIAQYLLRVILL